MLKFLEEKHLRLSDITFVLAILFAIPVITEGVMQMGVLNPQTPIVPLGLTISTSIITILLLAVGLFFEFKYYKSTVRLIPLAVSILLILIGCLTIFLAPEAIVVTYQDINGGPLELGTHISGAVRFSYFMTYLILISFIYIGIFVVPQRIKSTKIVLFLINCLMVVTLIAIIYSLITEFRQYGSFLQFVFGGQTGGEIKEYTIESFWNHRNMYGAYLEFSIFAAMAAYSLSKNKINFAFIALFFIEMIFTFCRTSLLISIVGIIAWVVVLLLVKFKDDKKKFIITISSICGAIAVILAISLTLIFAVPSINEMVVKMFEGGGTIVGRAKIWKKALEIISGHVVFGRGYGNFNSTLFVVNSLVLSDATFSTHSFFFSILGRAGIFGLLAFFALIAFTVKSCINISKKNLSLGITFLLVILGMLIHCIFEDHYYVLFIVSAVALFLDNALNPKEEKRLSLF